MALVDIPKKNIRLTEATEIAEYLHGIDIDYERWDNIGEIGPDASDAEILDFYSAEIEELKAKGGYVTADLINVTPETPGLDEMLAKFDREHWHDEDEVRFIVKRSRTVSHRSKRWRCRLDRDGSGGPDPRSEGNLALVQSLR